MTYGGGAEGDNPAAPSTGTFGRVLDLRVRAVLATARRAPFHEREGVKSAVLVVWLVGSLAVLVAADLDPLAVVAVAASVGVVLACGLLTVGHETMHRPLAAPRGPGWWTARLFGMTMGLGEPWWRAKHNITHHGGVPDGGRAGEGPVDLGPVARMAPSQAWHPWHVAQPLYLPLLFPLHLLMMVGASTAFAWTGRTSGHQVVAATPGWRASQLGRNLCVPIVLVATGLTRHGAVPVLASTLLVAAVAGTTLSLALAVEPVHRGLAQRPAQRGGEAWSRWQVDVAMTIDTPNALTVWLVGGLNYHTEHHLYPRAPLHRLGEVSRVVRATCDEFGVPYHRYAGYPSSWRGFLAFAHQMGRVPTPADPAELATLS